MLDHWNERCLPPWKPSELAVKVRNAYAYAQNRQGDKAAEAALKPVARGAIFTGKPTIDEAVDIAVSEHPLGVFNRNFAHVLAGGGAHILWETTDAKGNPSLIHLDMSAFRSKFAADKISRENSRPMPMTQAWIEWRHRRSYDGIVFMPERQAPDRFYNLWRGFAVKPLVGDPPEFAAAMLARFKEHLLLNVCAGDKDLCLWLWGYFAHMIQRPWEKPLTALVLHGKKGTGKNVVFDIVGGLLGDSFMVTANKRFLVGNFNGHMERMLLFVLDEAFWSGDKQAEGVLKDLITGRTHLIEHKGKGVYTVDNLTRIAVLGNETWLVPATADERRFAVFKVGNGRQKQAEWFAQMKDGLIAERGGAAGAALLLRELQSFDLSRVDINKAPNTAGLLDQKHAGLEPLAQWWLESLEEGYLVSSTCTQWESVVGCRRLRDAFGAWVRSKNIRSRVPGEREIGKLLGAYAGLRKSRKRIAGCLEYCYEIPSLDECRVSWEMYIGHEIEWPS